MINFSYTVWIPLIPFLMFLLLGLAGHKLKPKLSGLLGTGGLALITILSYLTAYRYFFVVEKVEETFQKITAFNITWLQLTDKLHIDLGVLLDPISVMMLVVISTVSLMVHIYSLGYMKGEKGFERFFAFLSLFSFSMLGLVLATNIFQMYIFWELVGVSSFLLIGFYYEKPSAVRASKKAFIVTRFADLGFLIGILILSFNTKTFDFISLTDIHGTAITQGGGIAFMGLSVMTWSMIFVFMGGVGKSAMFPFPYMASRCNGRPDSGFSPYSCCNNGCCRCIPRCKNVPDICNLSSGSPGSCSICRSLFITFCSCNSMYPDRYKKSACLFHNVADRLYDVCIWVFQDMAAMKDWVSWHQCSISLPMQCSRRCSSLVPVQ